jgi:hypothetical protein
MSLLFAGRTDMLTLMAMRWNQQKFNYLATSLTRRYQKVDMSHFFCLYSRCLLLYICVGITFFFCYLKATKGLESRLQDLEVMRVQLAVTQVEVEGWVTDVKEWAEGESYTITDQCVSSAEK